MLQFKPSLFLLSLLCFNTQASPVVEQACKSISNKLGSVNFSACTHHKLSDTGHRSQLNKPLLLKEYPPLGSKKPQARILVLGGIHGDEYSSVSIAFKWMAKLDRYHSGLFHWKIIPLVNPDGLLRKKSRRTNGSGVDLNRNFSPGKNNTASLNYWKNKTYKDSRRYPGPKPLSEPETRLIVNLIEEFKPDAIVAIHAPYGILDFDGPHKAPGHLGPLHLKLLGTYPGSLGNYAGLQLGKPVITIELPYAGIMPTKNEISKIWVDLVSWLKRNVHSSEQQPAIIEAQKSD